MNFNMFQDQGLFSVPQITAAVNRIPYAPRLIQALNLYQDVPVCTLNPIIERRFGTRQVLQAVPFGVRNNVHDVPKRRGGVMRTWSINTSTMVTKQDSTGIRRFGTMEAESIASILADRLEWMRQDAIESTIESWRMQALLGSIMNPDSSVLVNWYNFFDVTPTTMPFSAAVLAPGSAGVRGYCKSVKDAINDAFQGMASTGFVGILGDNAWNHLFSIDEIKDAYKYRSVGDQTTSVAFMTETPGTPNPNQNSINWSALANVFTYSGITFLNYRSSVDFPTNKAVFFPMGVRDMFQSILSPSSLIEEEGEMGTPFYARTWVREDGSGIDVYVETNRIEVNSLPEACIQATFSA
jgi:hypothetical protein